MIRTCPNCSSVNPTRHVRCTQCGKELIDNGMLIDAVTYWDEKGSRKSLVCGAVLLGAVGMTIAVHHLFPLAAGLVLAAYLTISSDN